MKKVSSIVTTIALMLSFTIMTGCASISNRPTNSSEGGTQSLKEMLPLIKLPVKKVSIFSCAHLRVLYGQKLSVQVAEKYSEASQKIWRPSSRQVQIFSRMRVTKWKLKIFLRLLVTILTV